MPIYIINIYWKIYIDLVYLSLIKLWNSLKINKLTYCFNFFTYLKGLKNRAIYI